MSSLEHPAQGEGGITRSLRGKAMSKVEVSLIRQTLSSRMGWKFQDPPQTSDATCLWEDKRRESERCRVVEKEGEKR